MLLNEIAEPDARRLCGGNSIAHTLSEVCSPVFASRISMQTRCKHLHWRRQRNGRRRPYAAIPVICSRSLGAFLRRLQQTRSLARFVALLPCATSPTQRFSAAPYAPGIVLVPSIPELEHPKPYAWSNTTTGHGELLGDGQRPPRNNVTDRFGAASLTRISLLPRFSEFSPMRLTCRNPQMAADAAGIPGQVCNGWPAMTLAAPQIARWRV